MLCLASAGCGGYLPVRWPSRELWVASPIERREIALPNSLEEYPLQATRRDVTLAVTLLDTDDATRTFGLNLLQRRIQPVLLRLENHSDQIYIYRKAGMNVRHLPAARVAAYGTHEGGGAIAILIQEMVEADTAGVAFSVDPISGDRNTATVSAVAGLGPTE